MFGGWRPRTGTPASFRIAERNPVLLQGRALRARGLTGGRIKTTERPREANGLPYKRRAWNRIKGRRGRRPLQFTVTVP